MASAADSWSRDVSLNERRALFDALDAPALRRWRRRLGLSLEEAADALGIDVERLEKFESGTEPIPKANLLAASAIIANLHPIKPWHGFPRADWVQLVEDMRAYGNGEPVVGRLIRAGEVRRLHVFLSMVRQGPDLDLAMTDPALFRMLSMAVMRARLSGLANVSVSRAALEREELLKARAPDRRGDSMKNP